MTMTTISAITVTSPITLSLTEHNRSTLPIQYEAIENARRTANGTMRKFVVAKKKNIQLSWGMLPSRSNMTVDGKSGAEALKDLYENYYEKPLTIQVKYHHTPAGSSAHSSDDSSTTMSTETLTVFITSFSYDVIRRMKDSQSSGFDYVNVSIGFTEV